MHVKLSLICQHMESKFVFLECYLLQGTTITLLLCCHGVVQLLGHLIGLVQLKEQII